MTYKAEHPWADFPLLDPTFPAFGMIEQAEENTPATPSGPTHAGGWHQFDNTLAPSGVMTIFRVGWVPAGNVSVRIERDPDHGPPAFALGNTAGFFTNTTADAALPVDHPMPDILTLGTDGATVAEPVWAHPGGDLLLFILNLGNPVSPRLRWSGLRTSRPAEDTLPAGERITDPARYSWAGDDSDGTFPDGPHLGASAPWEPSAPEQWIRLRLHDIGAGQDLALPIRCNGAPVYVTVLRDPNYPTAPSPALLDPGSAEPGHADPDGIPVLKCYPSEQVVITWRSWTESVLLAITTPPAEDPGGFAPWVHFAPFVVVGEEPPPPPPPPPPPAGPGEPDYEAIAIAALRSSALEELLDPDDIGTKLRRGWTASTPALRVTRVGGLPTEGAAEHLTRGRLQIEAYAPDEPTALALANAAHLALRGLPTGTQPAGVVITRTAKDLPLANSPDPESDAARYLFGVVIHAHLA